MDEHIITAERAVLTSDIVFTKLQDITTQFIIPMLTPTQDNSSGEAKDKLTRAPSVRSQNRSVTRLKASNYITSNNVSLTIPAYIVAQFKDPFVLENKIPKGTEFIITGIGQKIEVDHLRIIGIYKIGEG